MALKADLHVHTREGEHFVEHDARGLIDRAAALGFDVLSLTDHDTVTFDDALAAYARDRSIVLVPGVEATIEGAHVLVYNLDVEPQALRTFADLRRLRRPDWLVAAPHPFFPARFCLRARLAQELDLFDAVELSHFYTASLDFNRPAVRLAAAAGLPLIGTSDSHLVRQLGTTYSLIEAEPTVDSVLDAIRAGRVHIVSRPLSWREAAAIAGAMLARDYRERLVTRVRPRETAHAR